jgi:hypothetical protein
MAGMFRLFELFQPPPVVTVISDLVTVHPAWLTPQARLVVAPTEPAHAACRQLGMPAERLLGRCGTTPDQLIGSFRFLGRPLLVTSVTRSV